LGVKKFIARTKNFLIKKTSRWQGISFVKNFLNKEISSENVFQGQGGLLYIIERNVLAALKI